MILYMYLWNVKYLEVNNIWMNDEKIVEQKSICICKDLNIKNI